ncbi:hypothetical protein ES705_07963 [subsurface metagenome]
MIFLDSLDDTVLWFPQAKREFKYLFSFATAAGTFESPPSVFIHTDHLPNQLLYKLFTEGELETSDEKIILNDIIDLSINWDYKLDYQLLSPCQRKLMACYYGHDEYMQEPHVPETGIEKWLRPKSLEQLRETVKRKWFSELVESIKLLKVTYEFDDYNNQEDDLFVNQFDTYILYFFHEQVQFFKKFFIEEALKVKFLRTEVYDDRKYFPSRFFELFMGYMGVEYLLSDLQEIPVEYFSLIQQDTKLVGILNHPDNHKYLLESVISLTANIGISKVKYYT